jgi:hypothetical protein
VGADYIAVDSTSSVQDREHAILTDGWRVEPHSVRDGLREFVGLRDWRRIDGLAVSG